MADDYLWDGSGEPDPEVQRLERLLGSLRHDRPAPALPARRAWLPRVPALRVRIALTAAAGAILLAGAWLTLRGAGAPAYEVAALAGAPTVGSRPVDGGRRLSEGAWVETDAASRARIAIEDVGRIDVEPATRLRLLRARRDEHRLALARGTISAVIVAPPRLFFVETPSAVAVDLGCAYRLSVDPSGAGLLHVTAGWVGFERDGRESFVPAGASCATRPDVGPGTPRFEDATAGLVEALETFDFGAGGEAGRAAALDAVLAEARPRDALTLWHLLWRTDGEARGRVYEKMVALTPPPSSVTREGILSLDRRMLHLWRNALLPGWLEEARRKRSIWDAARDWASGLL